LVSFGFAGKVAAQLADILEQRAVVTHHVVPEFTRGELLADHHRAAVEQHRADRHHAAGGVIHRQAVVHAVVRLGVHHAGEGAAREHHPVVVDVGGLRQAGGAGRVDVKRAVFDGQLCALRLRQRVSGQRVDHGVEPWQAGALAMRPDLGARFEQWARGRQHVGKLACDHDVLRLDDIDAMGERWSNQIEVDQGGDAARTGDAEPSCNVFRPVRHQEADRLALLQALLPRPTRIAVGALCKRAIAEALALGDQRRRVAEFLRKLGDDQREHPCRMFRDRCRHLQRAQRALQIDEIVLQVREEAHASRSAFGRRLGFSRIAAVSPYPSIEG
jgi:hypothetical protein